MWRADSPPTNEPRLKGQNMKMSTFVSVIAGCVVAGMVSGCGAEQGEPAFGEQENVGETAQAYSVDLAGCTYTTTDPKHLTAKGIAMGKYGVDRVSGKDYGPPPTSTDCRNWCISCEPGFGTTKNRWPLVTSGPAWPAWPASTWACYCERPYLAK